ncbi:MBL fold metallo-hydrolase [Candidatus Thorarchaeota archaeon]|nr:MAG: MBL fold metallo-hydrolase [Candidatus Thorarchaeota archaeon]
MNISFNLGQPSYFGTMPIQRNYQIFAGMVILLIGVAVTAVMAIQIMNTTPQIVPDNNSDDPIPSTLNITLLTNAGVMIETNETRIYIDPIQLNESFTDYPADIVCVTHPHADHYDTSSIDIVKTEDTVFIFPANMSDAVSLYDAIAVVPGVSVLLGDINITAFYMYTFSEYGYPASHPIEANWTSFIIEIDGFTVFHAGDSRNIIEYYQIRGQIDLAFFPLGPGCQTMTNYEVVSAIIRVEPTFFIPIHFEEGAQDAWIASYGDNVEESTECTPIVLDYWTMHSFELS